MRVPVKLLGFVFWLFFFNCGQCKECLREEITYEHTEPTAENSYKDGETVKVNCMSGFTGMYRLLCEKGTWKTTNRRPCAKKKCSHPGDTPNGDFKLIVGSEFVFGTTVLYTCKKGFEMTSRINQRTCRAQGWDNTLPVCEAVKCPAIHTDGGVTASGNTEEGNYGDVIHFECVSSDKKIHGSSDIHCTERGDWSDSVPTCKEITCRAPDIPNGYVVERVEEYQKDAVLKYRCLQGFKPREGIPRCAKFGWTLNPECDEVTCVLKSTTFGVKEINPAGKTIFRAGERVEITCTEKHWIFSTKESIKSFTCRDDGQWDHDPVCAEIRCEVPRDQHVDWLTYYFRGDRKLGTEQYYRCISGYDKMAEEATCTRDGWTPNPLCAEKMCAAPNIPNAEIVGDQRTKYRISSRIQYKCNTGFEPEQPLQITCNSQTEWTGIQQCTAKQKLCPDLSVDKGLIYIHSNEEELIYSCNTGYKTFTGTWWDSVTCSKGSWSEEPRCIPVVECGAFPKVHHGKLKQMKKTFRDGETTAFECDAGFIPTQDLIECVNGTWKAPVCKGVRCGIPPKVENALITSKPKEFYEDGSRVTYVCQKSFLMNGESTISCRNGSWEETPTCREITCELNSTTSGVKMINPADKTIFRAGERVEITCTETDGTFSTKETIKSFTCQDDWQWDLEPVCEEIRCEVPRDPLVSGPEDYFTGVMKLGSKRSYQCISGYKRTSAEAKCTREGWTPNPLCAEIRCEVPDDPHVSRPELYFTGDLKLGEIISYECISGYERTSAEAICTRDGWTPNPLCADIRCEVPHDQHVYRPDLYFTGELKLGSIRSYHCISGYYQMAAEAICTRDGWTPNPLCAGQ